uniref:Uncharacterized protein n=1 Tax=Cacopsylla melanoneura TaxID=428564 RepID=A0A8D8W904_9HEMI
MLRWNSVFLRVFLVGISKFNWFKISGQKIWLLINLQRKMRSLYWRLCFTYYFSGVSRVLYTFYGRLHLSGVRLFLKQTIVQMNKFPPSQIVLPIDFYNITLPDSIVHISQARHNLPRF